MPDKINNYFPNNVIDTCSIWNLLSSKTFYTAVLSTKINLCCTRFVVYECIYKSRRDIDDKQKELIRRFKEERDKSKFKDYNVTIEDLQNIDILRNRKRQSKGELSSMIFAKKTNQAFITDDRSARKLAKKYLGEEKVQTIPLLFGHLVYRGIILDNQVAQSIREHKELENSITKWLKDAYRKALEKNLLVI